MPTVCIGGVNKGMDEREDYLNLLQGVCVWRVDRGAGGGEII